MQLTGGFVKLVLNRTSKTGLSEAYLLGVQLSKAADPVRNRKILLNGAELRELQRLVQVKGNTIVPLKMYFKRGWAKVTLGVGAGRKNYDKRDLLRMLFSPKSGKQNRATLAKEGRKVAKAATKVVQNVEKQAPKALAAAKKKQVKKA